MSLQLGSGNKGLRWDRGKLTAAQIEAATAATDTASAKLLCNLKKGSMWFQVENSLDVDVVLTVTLSGDDDRKDWIEIPAGGKFEIKTGDVPGFRIDVKTTIYVYRTSVAGSGAVRLNSWG